MLLLWLVSVRLGDPSFVDAWWPMGFVVVGWTAYAGTEGDRTRGLVLAGLVTVWGLRLGGYLFWRWRRTGADKRYVFLLSRAKGSKHAFTLTRVFLLQGVLLWLVSMPLQLGQVYAEPAGLQPLGYAGVALALVGIGFESVGDAQLVRFKADPASAGRVMDRGLWRYTRHPNYFGDACLWWGVFLVALVNAVTAIAVIGPLAMTALLARWSGVGPLERGLHRTRPAYADYVARTSAFIPRPPRAKVDA